jgi:pimeloyl-ACP methyl ester carboxylesterase
MTTRNKLELLFLHALPFDGSMWAAQMHLLPGSTYAPTPYPFGDSIEAWAAAALNIPKGDRIVVVGCSVGGSCAMLAPTLPVATLAFAGLMLVNAIFFHVMPVLITRRFSPGLMTALIIFLPLGVAVFWFALANELVTSTTAIAGLIVGAVIMAYPIVMLKVRDKPFFRQPA